MSGPSFSNIDLWLFELAEGNLSSSQVEQLELFLLQNPDVDIDRDVWEMSKITPTQEIYPNQEELQRKRRPIAWFYLTSAASVALLFGTTFMSNDSFEGVGNDVQLAKNEQHAALVKLVKEEVAQIRAKEIQFSNENNNASLEDATTSVNQSLMSNEQSVNDTNVDVNSSFDNSLQNSEESTVNNNTRANNSSRNHSISFANFENDGTYIVESNSIKNGVENSPNKTSNNDIISVSNKAMIAKGTQSNIEPNPAEEIEVLSKDDYALSSRTETKINHNSFGSSGYKKSMKSKLFGFSRAVQRMMNNPIALKNYRDPSYHVPGMLPNDINFSSAGSMLRTRVQTLSRLQWMGQKNEQLMNQISVDGYSYGMRGGVGLQINHSMYNGGGIKVASAALTYSPKFSINKSISFEPSVRFKMGNKTLDASKMEGAKQVEMDRQSVEDYYPNGQAPIGSSLWYKDLGAGLMVNTEWFYIGAQVDNLFRHENNIFSNDISNPDRAAYHIIATVGTDWVNKKENMSFSPYMVYQKNDKLSEAWLGANFRYNWFVVGAGFSTLMDPAASIGLKFKRFSFTYNADYSLSKMTNTRSLSHQVTLKFVGKPSRFGRRILNL